MSDTSPSETKIIYHERQWVPWSWWIFAGLVVALLTGQMAHNRSQWYLWIPAIVFTATALWALLALSSTVIDVVEDSSGLRWLKAGQAMLPSTVVSRSLAVPASAKSAAMGRQLDPAAFVISHGWVPQMAMFVLDDPDDPVPYWLIGSKHPSRLISAFLQSDSGTEAKNKTTA